MKFSYCFILTFIMLSFIVKAQRVSFEIIDSNQRPIEKAEIFIQNYSSRFTDSSGIATFSKVYKGEYDIVIFASEYAFYENRIHIQSDTLITIQLDELSVEIEGLEIRERRAAVLDRFRLSDADGTEIYAGKRTEVVNLEHIQGNLAVNRSREVYAKVSGLNIYEGNDGGLQLNIGGRGLDPNRTSNFNTRQNSYDISADILGYPENYYTPPSEALSEIRIVRGASALQYGTQFGGLIDFRTREIAKKEQLNIRLSNTYSSFNSFNSFNYLGFNHSKLSINSFYNFKRGDGYRDNSHYKAHNAFVSLLYSFSDQESIKAEYTYFNYLAKQAGGLTDTQFELMPRLSTRDRNWFEIDWHVFNVYYNKQFKNRSELTVNIFGLYAKRHSLGFRGDPRNLNENPILAIDERDTDGNYILQRDLIKGLFKNFGSEIKFVKPYQLFNKKSLALIGTKIYIAENLSEQGPGSKSADADFSFYYDEYPEYANQSSFEFPNKNVAIFGENILYANDDLSIIPGFRYEYIHTAAHGDYLSNVYDNAGNLISSKKLTDDKDLERSFLLLGLGFKYKRSEKLSLIANITQNYRSVTFSDIRVVNPTFIVDPNIKDESGFTIDVGINGKINRMIDYDINTYSIIYDDRIGIILDNRANRVRKNIGKAGILGLETLINFNLISWEDSHTKKFHLNYFINSAFTHSQYLESENQNVKGKQVEFVPRVNLKTGINLRYRNATATYLYSYISDQYTDAQNSEISTPGDKKHGIVGEIPSYMVSDISLSYRYKLFKIVGGINNLYNHHYFTRRATGYPGPGIIPSEGRSFYLNLIFTFAK